MTSSPQHAPGPVAGPGRLRRARNRDDAGSLSLELIIMLPVVLAIIFVAIQAALVEHGRHVALAIAERADRAGRAYLAGDPASTQVQQARRQAAQTLADQLTPALGGEALHDVQPLTTTFSGGGGQVSVQVTAKVSGPFGDMTVSQRAAGPVEQFVTGT